MSYHDDGDGWLNVLGLVFVILCASCVPIVSCNECATVCGENNHKPKWTVSQGCFCRDDKGLYNPRDSRQ